MRLSWYRTTIGWLDFDAGPKTARICSLFIIRRIVLFASLDKGAQIHPSMAVF